MLLDGLIPGVFRLNGGTPKKCNCTLVLLLSNTMPGKFSKNQELKLPCPPTESGLASPMLKSSLMRALTKRPP